MLRKHILYLMLITLHSINSMNDFTSDEIKEKEETISQENNFANNRDVYKNSGLEAILKNFLQITDLTHIVCDYLNNFDDWEITEHFNLPWNQQEWHEYRYHYIKYLPNNKLIISSRTYICIYDIDTKKTIYINDYSMKNNGLYGNHYLKYCISPNGKIAVYSEGGMISILNINGQTLQQTHFIISRYKMVHYAEFLPNGNFVTYASDWIYHPDITIKKTWDTSSELPQEIKKPLAIKCLESIEINENNNLARIKFNIDYNKKFEVKGTKEKCDLIIWPNKKNISYRIRLPKLLESQPADSLFCFFNNDNNFAVLANDTKKILIVNSKAMELVKDINLPDKFIYAGICTFSSNKLAILYHKTVDGNLMVAIVSNPLFEKEKIKQESLKDKIVNFFKKIKK